MTTLTELIQAATDATLENEYPAQEKALQEAKTAADWQECFDAFGERTIAEFVCGWADEDVYGPAEGEGIAMLKLDDGSAIVAEWFNDGRYDVTFCTLERATAALAAALAEVAEAEENDDDC